MRKVLTTKIKIEGKTNRKSSNDNDNDDDNK